MTQPLTYMAVHQRLRRERGPAREYACHICGQPADQWAYDRMDLHAVIGETKYGRGDARPYSTDLAHYVPMCQSCHTRLDRGTAPVGSAVLW